MHFSLEDRIGILCRIGDYITSEDIDWLDAKARAERENPWFTQTFISYATENISRSYLQKAILEDIGNKYQIPQTPEKNPAKVGIVNAGNIPLVGFQDFLSAFLVGLPCQIKLSSKDKALFTDIHRFIKDIYPEFEQEVELVDRLQDCDAYIATGGDSSNVYFKKYFGNKPNIIRGHRSSVAILTGEETTEQLCGLSRDIHLYFGLGCRSVSHVFVPQEYDFPDLLASFSEFDYFQKHSKYMNNYDYQLALDIVNSSVYMTNGTTLLRQNAAYTSPISVVHYSQYNSVDEVRKSLDLNQIQCIVSREDIPFGESQKPNIMDFADGIDTFQFCRERIH